MERDYQVAVKSALETAETLTTLLYVLIKNTYGDEAFDWDPTTLYLELREDFNAEPATEVMDRIAAAQILATTGAFFERPDAFINICNTIADGSPSFSVFDTATTEECAWGLVEVSLIRDLLPFHSSVRRYVFHTLAQDGYDSSNPPDIFSEFFDKTPDADEVVDAAQAIAPTENHQVLAEYVDEQMQALIHQFNEIPGLSDDLMRLLDEKDLEEEEVATFT